jgi:hypothetical protein
VSILRGLIYLLVVEQETHLRHVRKQYDDAGSQLFEGPNALYKRMPYLLYFKASNLVMPSSNPSNSNKLNVIHESN